MSDLRQVDSAEWREEAKKAGTYAGGVQAHRVGLPSRAEEPERLTGHLEARDAIGEVASDTVDWVLQYGEPTFGTSEGRRIAQSRMGIIRATLDPTGKRFGKMTNGQLIEQLESVAREYATDSVQRVYAKEGWDSSQEQTALWTPAT